jgi:pyruvate ferredoxin oxidoreductase alpha subunit
MSSKSNYNVAGGKEMKKTLEGSIAVAEAIKNCDPDVAACYPITPSTHIGEHLSEFFANGELKSYVNTEAEISSIAALIGASAAGGRAVSVTASQGLAYMHESLFCAAGMRLPMLIVVGNRSLSAPLSIWNDWQDSIAERDSGCLQFYAENNQEAVDLAIQGFKISEAVNLPALMGMDGFYLTHSVEPLDIPEKSDVQKFLPARKSVVKLDSANPITMGAYAFPKYYQGFREDLHKDLTAAKTTIKQVHDEFAKQFGRKYGNGLIEEYKTKDADYILISMGSAAGNAKDAADELRAQGEKVGVLRIRCYRPFPSEDIAKALDGKKGVGVFEKAYSLGAIPPVYGDVSEAITNCKTRPQLSSFVGGLGGKDVTVDSLKILFGKLKKGVSKEWV